MLVKAKAKPPMAADICLRVQDHTYIFRLWQKISLGEAKIDSPIISLHLFLSMEFLVEKPSTHKYC